MKQNERRRRVLAEGQQGQGKSSLPSSNCMAEVTGMGRGEGSTSEQHKAKP